MPRTCFGDSRKHTVMFVVNCAIVGLNAVQSVYGTESRTHKMGNLQIW